MSMFTETARTNPWAYANVPRRKVSLVQMTGYMAAAGGLVGCCSLPWLIDGRKVSEVDHAKKARADLQNAVLALAGMRRVDNSSHKSVFLGLDFQDTDTFTVPNGPPRPAEAHTLVVKAANELQGTAHNAVEAKRLSSLASEPELSVNGLLDEYPHVRTNIVNGDMIRWRDVAEGGAFLSLIAVGATVGYMARKSE